MYVQTRDELERKCGAILSEVEMLEEKRLKHENDRQTQSSSSDASTLVRHRHPTISQAREIRKARDKEYRQTRTCGCRVLYSWLFLLLFGSPVASSAVYFVSIFCAWVLLESPPNCPRTNQPALSSREGPRGRNS